MTKNQKLSVVFGVLLLLACEVASAHAQPARRRGADIFKPGDYVAKPGEAKPEDANTPRTVTELRCRGGDNAFSLDEGMTRPIPTRDGMSRIGYFFQLDFRGGIGPARADGSGLEPGTCSWIDQALSASEPRQIRFDAHPLLIDIGWRREEDKRTSMSKYFNDPSHFWSFFVSNSGEGYFSATEHKLWIDRSKVGVEGRRRP